MDIEFVIDAIVMNEDLENPLSEIETYESIKELN